jgi:hypothetical protein
VLIPDGRFERDEYVALKSITSRQKPRLLRG